MQDILENIPDLKVWPLQYVFEKMKLEHKSDTLWLEFGVATGSTISYISQFTRKCLYGFDSFEGLPEKWRDGFEKGTFTRYGNLPSVPPNCILIKGWFNETLEPFLHDNKDKKISFIHMDADLYSSTKYIFNTVKDKLDKDCVIVFDELVNYSGYDGENGELRAFYEFLQENDVKFTWIGMNGEVNTFGNSYNEAVAVIIHSVSPKLNAQV